MRLPTHHSSLATPLYFDYAASTPVDSAVLKAMKPYFSEKFGNPGSLHSFGQEAIAAIDSSREAIAKILNVGFRDVIFASSATEANNLVLKGLINSLAPRRPGPANSISETATAKESASAAAGPPAGRVIVSAIEHESVLETARALEKQNKIDLKIIPVDKNGIIDLKEFAAALSDNTVLVSIMYVNNEIGSVQPLSEIAEIIRKFRPSLSTLHSSPAARNSPPFFHSDAAQAFNYFDCSPEQLGVDFLTLSSQKIFGPKGASALVINKKFKINHESKISQYSIFNILHPILNGGGQEFGLRSGTENVPAIVGFGKAAAIASSNCEKEGSRLMKLKLEFWKQLGKSFPRVQVNGSEPSAASPHLINAHFPGHRSQDLLTKLDLNGIAASAGAACGSRSPQPSYVITALGHSRERALSSIRFSFGRQTGVPEIKHLLKVLKKVLR